MTGTALELNNHPATALAIQPGQISWDPMQLAALGQLGLTDASDGDRSVFLHVSQRTGLDPFARQIYMIPRREKVPGTQNWRTKWTIQTGIEGWRVIRDRAERRYGVRGTLSRATWYDGDGNEHKVWVRPDPPAACELTYTVKDSDGTETPYTSVLQFREYAQTGSDGSLIAQWGAKKSHMLEKCTEADVYRKAFPQDFSGIYLDDTMPQQQEDAPPAPPRGRVTAGEIIERGPAAEDDWPRGTVTRHNSDASDEGAKQEATPRPPARATSGQLSMLGQRLGKLGVDDENRLSTLEKLAGRDLGEPKELTQDEAAHIRGLLDRCKEDRGALVELLATGQLPEAEKTGGGDD